ncbi:phosphatase PAP2 family protein [Rhodococcus sp. HNM0563]|uniref:bifunctional phosphatase PAP2/diacylglycerol kinase family protein n=1 Tax=Rhodococcus sp. HNM0563 TaxID=2716339 RepID=UPI003216BB0F
MTFRRRAREADHALFALTDRVPTAVDPLFRRLTRSADHSVLWMGCAALCVLCGGRVRRGAVRGLASVAGASALANGLLKPLLPRRRPPARTDPRFARRLVPIPTSSSFPSGHSASAAAFVTGVALESPAAGAALAPLAAAVAYSRVHTGVHWPGDVAVGAVVGAAVALSTRRWWAVRADEPARADTAADAPALPDGRGLLVVVNPRSGSSDATAAALADLLPRARIELLDPDTDLGPHLDRLIAEAHPSAVGVCGGDGTVATVAAAAHRHALPLAVFPGGTLNHFAVDVGARTAADTAHAVTSGQAARIDLGTVTITGPRGHSDRLFLNTASLGGYPDAVRLRETWEPRIGKWPAAAAAMIAVLATAAPIRAHVDGTETALWLLFAGNGCYRPTDQVPMSRIALDAGTLDVRYLRADRRWSRLRLLFAAATGTLGASSVYRQRDVTSVSVRLDGPPVASATDGEVNADGTAFEMKAVPSALTVYRLPDSQLVP